MIKKILFLLLIPFLGFSQNIDDLFSEKGEIYFSFEYTNKSQLNQISDIVSIDHKTTDKIAYAYANKREFSEFLKLDINYTIIKKEPLNFTPISKNNWNYYPTYQEYVDMMIAFADSFPDICKLHHLGTLNSGSKTSLDKSNGSTLLIISSIDSSESGKSLNNSNISFLDLYQYS